MQEKKKTGYTVTLNDIRGEYWLYAEGGISVNVGRGGNGHFNTGDMHQQTGPAIDNGQAAVILARVMARFAGEQGDYRRLVLCLDGKYELSEEDLAVNRQRAGKIRLCLRAHGRRQGAALDGSQKIT